MHISCGFGFEVYDDEYTWTGFGYEGYGNEYMITVHH